MTRLIGFLLVLAGCATEAKYRERLNRWVGSSEEDLIASFGVPTSTHPLTSGGKIILYRNRGTAKIGGGEIGPTEVDNKGTTWCETTFTIDSKAIVKSWNMKGNACRSN